jgi:multiple sugar transport system substrate-binding protein
MSKLTRRQFSARVAGTALASTGFCTIGRSARAETTLRWFWWGNPERNKRTYAVVDLYDEKHPDVAIEAETISWDDYWAKMATQASGRNLADVVQMDYRYLFEYARRQQLEPLDGYDSLDLSHFDESFLDSGRVDGKLYAVPWTSNSIACFYDQEKLAEFGVSMPDHTWTYDDLRSLAGEIKKQAPESYWGVADKGHWEPALECFLRQRGKALYDADGGLAYGEEDVADYFGLWQGMRDEGLVPTPEITFRDDADLENMPLTTGMAAIDFAHSNQLVALQALNPRQLAMNMFPNQTGGQPGQYLKPSMLISVSATSQVKEEAVRFTSFLASDLEAAAILRVERGVPGDRRVVDFLAEEVDPQEKMMIDYLAIVADNVSPLPPPPPNGAGEIERMLLRMYPELTFGRLSVADAASQFYTTAESILRRT